MKWQFILGIMIGLLITGVVGVIAGSTGLIDIGISKPIQDKVDVIVTEKKITQEQFIQNAVDSEIKIYDQQKLSYLRIQLNKEYDKCMQSNNITYMQECIVVLSTVNSRHTITPPIQPPIVEEPKEEQLTP